ncbi:hypothetical protein PCL_02385 [Purpureocillium lilacinum]|uniref:Uncharacterized protein n=1 Tax=Purpureocillium lilacinum TaxID=33203 RepID=A0A2U3E0G9_PURLI|nr:hypothetical protein Purlil1_11600 [Purpureocillium lilacinum]PWI67984.1 hypothetical protein PCL_02385 [Purpureocillium lilacinum]
MLTVHILPHREERAAARHGTALESARPLENENNKAPGGTIYEESRFSRLRSYRQQMHALCSLKYPTDSSASVPSMRRLPARPVVCHRSLAAQLRAEPPTGCPCAVRRLRCPPCPLASVPSAASAGTVRPFTVLDLPTANHASTLPPLDASMTRGFPLARPAYRLATVRAPRHPHPQARCEHCKAGTRSWTAAGTSGASRDKAAPAPETALPVRTCCAGGIKSRLFRPRGRR